MSARSSPDCEALLENHENDSQSECSTQSRKSSFISDDTVFDSVSSTVLAHYGSESDRGSSVDLEEGLDPHLYSRRSEPEVDLLGAGYWAQENGRADLPREGHAILQELCLENEPTNRIVTRRPCEEEEPWSLFNAPITWIMCQPRLIGHTKTVIQQFFNFDMAAGAGDAEGTWIGPRDIHRQIRLTIDTLLAMVVLLAVIAILVLGHHGIELSFRITYGLVFLAVGVLAVLRLLFA